VSFALDPEVAAVLAAMAETSGPMPAPPPVGDVDNRRVALNAMLEYANNTAQPVAGDVDITDREVTTGDGTAIRARWYSSPTSDSRAAVLYLHGGGMIVGSVPIFDGPVSRYVASTGVPMLSVDYRLAPEHPHPTPVEDAYTGLLRLAAHADELGVNADRIAVMGDSAGGGIAAAVAILSATASGRRSRARSCSTRCSTTAPPRPTRTSPRSRGGATTTTSPAGRRCSAIAWGRRTSKPPRHRPV